MIFPKPLFNNMRIMTTREELKQALRQFVFPQMNFRYYEGRPEPIKHYCLSFLKQAHDNVKMCYFAPEEIHEIVREEFFDTLLFPKEYYDRASVIDSVLPENWK